MCCKPNFFRTFLALVVIALLGGVYWYNQLEDRQKRFVMNILRQVPDLPGRYAI
jgi:hypothetical protein